MSKKRHRNRDESGMQSMNNRNNLFGGMNPQMLEMLGLGNLDMNRLSMLMSTMNRDGFDINMLGQLLGGMPNNPMNRNMNTPMGNNPMGTMPGNMASMMAMMSNMNNNRPPFNNNPGFNTQNNNLGNKQGNINNKVNNNGQVKKEDYDGNIEMLLSIKRLVDEDKAKFLDKVIEMYKSGEIKY